MNKQYRGLALGLVLGFFIGIAVFSGINSYNQSNLSNNINNTGNIVLENSGESDVLPAETVLSELASAEEVSISEMSTNELWALRKMEAYTLPRLIKAGPDKIPSTEESVNEYLDNQAEKLILDDGKVYYLKVYNTLDECQESDDDIFIEIKNGEVDFSGYVSINSYHRIGDGEKFLANYIYSA